jgi:hypothetical protein
VQQGQASGGSQGICKPGASFKKHALKKLATQQHK